MGEGGGGGGGVGGGGGRCGWGCSAGQWEIELLGSVKRWPFS